MQILIVTMFTSYITLILQTAENAIVLLYYILTVSRQFPQHMYDTPDKYLVFIVLSVAFVNFSPYKLVSR